MQKRATYYAIVGLVVLCSCGASAQLPLPSASTSTQSQPTSPQPPSSVPPVPSATPISTQQLTSTTNQIAPVVLTYGEGVETRGQIVGGILQPIGIPPDKSVTVTIFLASSIPGTGVKLGLYDGGFVAAVAAPGQDISDMLQPPDDGPPLTVSAQATVQFNFQAGRRLGLYRVLLTVPPRQYLLQFYAVKPRSVLPSLPSPNPILPSPQPSTTPPPNNPPP